MATLQALGYMCHDVSIESSLMQPGPLQRIGYLSFRSPRDEVLSGRVVSPSFPCFFERACVMMVFDALAPFFFSPQR